MIACPPFAFEKFNTRFTKRCSRDEIVIVENVEEKSRWHYTRLEVAVLNLSTDRTAAVSVHQHHVIDRLWMLHEMLFQRLFTGISPMRSRDTHDTCQRCLCILKRIKNTRTTVVKAIRATSFWSVRAVLLVMAL
ncbi:hypothetical protein HALDL1_00095 (plasmid) [Halobacterium sp. DL1]|nr:hypothetical protein HALDL1_00095 [Halobacterium sp. DL1]